MSVIHVKTDDEFQELVEKYETCLVDFSASWCGPCRMIAPYYEQLASEYTKIKFLKVDVDELEKTAQAANIRAMPTFIIYKNGAITQEIARGANKDAIHELVQRNLPPEPPTPPVTPPTPPSPAKQDDKPEKPDEKPTEDNDNDKNKNNDDDADVKSETRCNCCIL